ncbi:multiple inositol polyphosphate phosphatase 1-like [Planococcus citri]|uniref:multiple inositol polyphosphate phosphatase 1-like n=1 Tax=Planococcus citri TaxID=170843 RepID=UPI0031F88125
MVIALVFFISLILRINAEFEQCFADVETPYPYFSSRTPYFASRTSDIEPETDCTPTYIWALIRHGTRYPGLKLINLVNQLYQLRNEIVLNHKEGRGELCQKDIQNLENWKTNLTADLEYELTFLGIDEEIFLAQKFKNAFPTLFESPTKDSFLFQSSAAKRTKDSAIAFTNELLGTNFSSTDNNNITVNEDLLHLNKHCPRYTKDVENNQSTYREVNLFKESDVVENSISNISSRLGYNQSLEYDSVVLMYDMCSYEMAWYLNSRPAFCAAFLPEDLKIFEYLLDMSDYHVKGYGTPYSSKMGCVTVKDMVMSLENAARDPESTRKGTFYFSHSETILPTTVKLGLHQDTEPLLHDNYDEMKMHRKWKLALFDSFAANIIAVLYKCHSSNGVQDIVSFYQNERKVVLPKCASNPCTLEDLKQSFSDVFDEDKCNFEFCHASEPLKPSAGYSSFINLSVFIVCTFVTYFV